MATINMNTIEKHPSHIIYDTAATTPVQGADADHSIVARAAALIHVDAIAAGSAVAVQCKTNNAAEWATVKTLDDTNTPAVVDVSHVNFTQLVRTGSDVFKAYAQGN